MYPGMPVFIQPPSQSDDLDRQEKELREDIASHERLVTAIYKALPAFVTESAIQRMGLENVAGVLADFSAALRDYFCCPMEYHLGQVLELRRNPPPAYKFPKPTIEDLARASLSVQRLEESLGAMEEMSTSEKYGMTAATNLMRPLIEQQLDQARDYLSRVQAAMEAPDEAPRSSMSNETPSGEAPVPE